MAYAYFKAKKHMEHAVFEVFFRKCPFEGTFTILAGVDDVLRFTNTFRFGPEQIEFVKGIMPDCDDGFFEWLETIDGSTLEIHSARDGSMVFPRAPVMRIEGPLAICQLLETTVLTLLNYASLVTTNASRYRVAAGFDKNMLEFGLRRAQGPDGGMSASRFVYMGGFDATSNVRASFLFGLPCKGTHAHAYVTAFSKPEDLVTKFLAPADGLSPKDKLFADAVFELRDKAYQFHPDHGSIRAANIGELVAFIAYAQAFPASFLALVDTYDVAVSGIPNYCFVAATLIQWGFTPVGIRLDSGDLSYLSRLARSFIDDFGDWNGTDLRCTRIVASNSITEEVLHSLTGQDHAIDSFGIGTHLVTCFKQPALGMVYKLCEIRGEPVMKISQEISKSTLPGKKQVYRLYDKCGSPLLDLIDAHGNPPPRRGERVFCQHITDETKRCYVVPSRVEPVLRCIWRNGRATSFGIGTSRLHSTSIGACSTSSASPPPSDQSTSSYTSLTPQLDAYDGSDYLLYLNQSDTIQNISDQEILGTLQNALGHNCAGANVSVIATERLVATERYELKKIVPTENAIFPQRKNSAWALDDVTDQQLTNDETEPKYQ